MVESVGLVDWVPVDWDDHRIERVLREAPLLCMSDEPLALHLTGEHHG